MDRIRPESLLEDVLLPVFLHLDSRDLVSCEAVCRQWKSIFQFGIPWRRYVQQKVAANSQWRIVWRKMELDCNQLKSAHYKKIYITMLRFLEEVDKNWRSGNFVQEDYYHEFDASWCDFEMTDNHVACYCYSNQNAKVQYFDIRSMELKRSISIPRWQIAAVDDKFATVFLKSYLRIFDAQTGRRWWRLTRKPAHLWAIGDCHRRDKLLAVYWCKLFSDRSSNKKEQHWGQLRVWQIKDTPRGSLLKNIKLYVFGEAKVRIDDQFITVSIKEPERADKYRTVYFISMETLTIARSMTVQSVRLASNGGLLLFEDVRGSYVRVFDVASGTFPHKEQLSTLKFRLSAFSLKSRYMDMNSKYMITTNYVRNKSEISVYDLQAIKNLCVSTERLLLYTFRVDFLVSHTLVNETQLVLINKSNFDHKTIAVLDFAAVKSPWLELISNLKCDVGLSP